MSVFKPFFQFGKATLQSLIWLVWIIRISLLLCFVFAVICVISFFTTGSNIPNSQEAPFAIVAITSDHLSKHIYYGETVLDNGNQLTVINCWKFNGKKYFMIKGEYPFIKNDWGDIQVYRR